MPIKVYELASELEIRNKDLITLLEKDFSKTVRMGDDLEEAFAAQVRAKYTATAAKNAVTGNAPAITRPAPATPRPANGATGSNGANGTNGAANRPVAPPQGTTGGASNRSAVRPPVSDGVSGGGATRPASPAAPATPPAPPSAPPAPTGEVVEVPTNITIRELGEKLGVGPAAVQKVLQGMGVLAGLNQRLAPDAVQRIAAKMGRNVRTVDSPAPATPVAPTAPPTPTVPEQAQAPAVTPQPTVEAKPAPSAPPVALKPAAANVPVKPANRPVASGRSVALSGRASGDMVARPPVVTIMGHVDHGKTTLLDTIRKASVASGEAGGITQHIGAYQVEHGGQRITFLDTPGHAAFSAMRARGARVTDIVVIVVAADDSIMPQTEEAITLAKEAGLPIIVAINKVDLPDAHPEQVMTDLASKEVVPEAFGGDVQTVNISAKKNIGIDDLLDTILLVSEAVVEPKADPHGKAQGTVIEAKLEKGRGAVVSVLVQQGTLTLGDVVVAGSAFGKIRTMTDEKGNKLTKAGPSTPVEIGGLNAVPDAGDRMEVAKNEREAREMAGERENQLRDERLGVGSGRVTLEALYKQLRQGVTKELNLVIKGDVQGSVQAVRDSVKDLGNDEVRVRILLAQVGAIGENDVLLAASDKDANAQNSLVVGFNVGTASPSVDKKAEQEHVTIKTYNIIYQLIDAVKEQMVGLLEPIYEEATLGKAEIRQLFKLPGSRKIAGSYVTEGLIRRNARARLYRGKDLLFTGDIDTLKRFTDDAREVATGYECGITLRDFNDLKEGDILECFEIRQIPREL